MREALLLGLLALLLLVGGGAAAAHFAVGPRSDRTVEGSFSPTRRADYSSAGERLVAPQQFRPQATVVTAP